MESPKETLINRRVLILDFVNTQKAVDFSYLENSIPDSLLSPLDKTRSFEILKRSLWKDLVDQEKFKPADAYNESKAILAGKACGADVVVIGSFVALNDRIRIFARAIELSSGRIMVSRDISAPLDNYIFETISKLTDEISVEMKEKLPPLPQQVITVEREKYITIEKTVEPAGTGRDLPMQDTSTASITYGGMIWRTLVVPGLGHVYAKQWRGWVYMPLWAGSTGAFVYSIFDFMAKEEAYQNATSDFESKYAEADAARKFRFYSMAAVMSVYAISLLDIMITGGGYVPVKPQTLNTISFSIETNLDGFSAVVNRKW
jgi:TolB-like protein